MIRETLSRKKNPSITSDRWHVIHARWSGEPAGDPVFVRTIVSEHDGRAAAVDAARKILSSRGMEMKDRSASTRDQILVRRPSYKSLKTAKRVEKRRK